MTPMLMELPALSYARKTVSHYAGCCARIVRVHSGAYLGTPTRVELHRCADIPIAALAAARVCTYPRVYWDATRIHIAATTQRLTT